MASVYLIHLEKPFKHAKHYIGYTALESVEDRVKRHKNNSGSHFLSVCNYECIDYKVVRTWNRMTIKDAKELERRIKKHSSTPLCPICNPDGYARRISKGKFSSNVNLTAFDKR